MNLNVTEAPEEGITIGIYQQIYKLVTMLAADLEGKGLLLTVLTLLFFFLYGKVWREMELQYVKGSRGLAFFFAVMYAAGLGYAYQDTITVLVNSSVRLLKTGIVVLGFWMIYVTAINVFYEVLRTRKNARVRNHLIGGETDGTYDDRNSCSEISDANFTEKNAQKTGLTSEKHPYLFYFIIIYGIWLIHLLLRYPGTMSYDNARELSYYFGYSAFTTAQPIFHSVLFGFFIQIGLWLGSENLGLFLFVLMQSAVMAAVLAYTLLQMKRWSAPKWLRVLTLVIYTCAPYYAGYASFPIKDYLYTAFFVLLVLYSLKMCARTLTVWEKVGFITAGTFITDSASKQRPDCICCDGTGTVCTDMERISREKRNRCFGKKRTPASYTACDFHGHFICYHGRLPCAEGQSERNVVTLLPADCPLCTGLWR